MREVDTNTFFTNTKSITLDSIYFQAGSRVQCAARAFNVNGDAGLELTSPIAVVSKEEGKWGGGGDCNLDMHFFCSSSSSSLHIQMSFFCGVAASTPIWSIWHFRVVLRDY